MRPCMALCGVMPKDAMGLDFDECRELAAGMQLMCVEILLGRQRADGILGARSSSGLTLTPAGTQRRQENIAQRQPKERWTVADTLPGEETAAFFDGGSRGNGTNGAVAGAGAVFYDKGVKQWEVEKPIAGRATNNVAEYVGFVSVLARLLRDPVPPTPRTIVVKGDSELVIGQIKGTKRCNETLRRYYDQAQNLLAKLHDRRTTIEPVHIPRELNKDADELSNRAMDTAQRQAAQAYSDSATAKGWAMRTALSRLGKIARVKAVHPALEMRVNHLTSLGGPILQGLNKRPQINNREAFEAVMRAFEVAAVRHVPKKMANKGERPLGEGGCPDRQLPTPGPLPTGVATQRREVEGTGKTRPGDAPPRTRRRQPPPLGRPSERREEESRCATVNRRNRQPCGADWTGSEYVRWRVARLEAAVKVWGTVKFGRSKFW
ncbi:Ribonuclease HI [Diplonema papillatum]|nr:Ribonuclease HI [Diplonema papillatum]